MILFIIEKSKFLSCCPFSYRVVPRKFFGFRLIYGPWCPSKTEAFREWGKNVWEHYFGI